MSVFFFSQAYPQLLRFILNLRLIHGLNDNPSLGKVVSSSINIQRLNIITDFYHPSPGTLCENALFI